MTLWKVDYGPGLVSIIVRAEDQLAARNIAGTYLPDPDAITELKAEGEAGIILVSDGRE